ncbi:MAG: hypothetical protein NZ703_06520, partial [Gemmataceae bacterium]|nr:hypothetical protein [Gemmataceae bacterium]
AADSPFDKDESVTDVYDPLSSAARCLARGEKLQAAGHLERYLKQQPQAHLFRFQLAEIYHSCQRFGPAQLHFELFVKYLPPNCGETLRQAALVAHTRLREYAQSRGDTFAEAYHRAAGLLLLAQSAQAIQPVLADELLGQARQALAQAQASRPSHPALIPLQLKLHQLSGHDDAAGFVEQARYHLAFPQPLSPTLSLNY